MADKAFLEGLLKSIGPKIAEQNHLQQCRADLDGGLPEEFWHNVSFIMPKSVKETPFFFDLEKEEPGSDNFQQKFEPLLVNVIPKALNLYKTKATTWKNPSSDCVLVLFTRLVMEILANINVYLQEQKNSTEKEVILPETFILVNACCEHLECPKNVLIRHFLNEIDQYLLPTKENTQTQEKQN